MQLNKIYLKGKIKFHNGIYPLLLIIFTLYLSCSKEKKEEFQPPDFEEFVDGKEDTGYVSNKAAELEAKLTTKVYIDMTGSTPEQIQQAANNLQNASRWTLQDYTTPQIKFARNALKNEKLDLNLEMGEPHILNITTDANGVWLNYSLAIESLVKFKELESKGLTPADLVGKTINFLLPAVPSQAWSKGGISCASDPDGATLDPAEVNEENYFYYFDPTAQGCQMKEGVDLIQATYEVVSSLDTPSVYPEYDLLTSDGKITMVALFGQIEHGELKSNDWGWTAYRDFTSSLQRIGFSTTSTFPNNFGKQMSNNYPGNLLVVIDIYSPEALKDSRDRSEVNQLFTDAIKNHEIVYYNGHSFYGSLSVLNNKDAYPVDTYQIIFMDSCWSYAYYTKQVFASKANENDPDGMKFADVVNNTEPGITGSHYTAFLLYKNIFEAASDYKNGEAPVKYSWNNLIKYMNESADARARWYDPEKFHAEIYGVSGAARNCFNPSGPSFCQNNNPDPQNRIFEDNSGDIPIPDNNPSGITRTIEVPQSFIIQNLSVSIEINHTYIGDLIITLSHGGKETVLHNRQGGGTDDIRNTFFITDFSGMDASGTWTLKVADFAPEDTGSLKKWRLVFDGGSTAPQPITAENNQQQQIPDNQQNGIVSIINITENVIIERLSVHLNITHSYTGDLLIVLQHSGIEAVLWNREGGSSANINSDFFPSQWNGTSAEGDWKLVVSDRASGDTGTLDSWSITITPIGN